MHILTLLFLLYSSPANSPTSPLQTPPSTIPLPIYTRTGWADFTSGFWLGGCGWCSPGISGTVHVQDLFKIAAGVWSVG